MASTITDRIWGVSSARAIKGPCRVATTGSVLLAGLQTVDDVLLTAGDRVLVKNQGDPTQNGIYVVDTAPWYRAADCSRNDDVVQGMLVLVVEGTANARKLYQLTNTFDAFGTSALNFLAVTTGAGGSNSGGSSDYAEVHGVVTVTGDGTTQTITLPSYGISKSNTDLFVGGVYQSKSLYSIVGSSLVLPVPIPSGELAEVIISTAGTSASAGETVQEFLSSLPTSLPSTAGVWWNNGGTLSQS